MVAHALKRGECTGEPPQWEEALDIYQQMKAAQVAPNAFTLQSLIRACEDGGEWEQASSMQAEAAALNLSTTLRDRYALDGAARPLVPGSFDDSVDDLSDFRTMLNYG
jgi:hypothetical protein